MASLWNTGDLSIRVVLYRILILCTCLCACVFYYSCKGLWPKSETIKNRNLNLLEYYVTVTETVRDISPLMPMHQDPLLAV